MKLLLVLTICAAMVSASSSAAEPWHTPLSLDNHGYWPQRVAVSIENGSSESLAGTPIIFSIPELAGATVEALRVCQTDGVELLFDLRDELGQARRTGTLSATDQFFVPATCSAGSSSKIFVYAGNPQAWPVADFLPARIADARTDKAKVRVTPGKIERLELSSLSSATVQCTAEWPVRLEVQTRNVGEQPATNALVRVDLRPAYALLPRISSPRKIRAFAHSGEVWFYRLGRGSELLLPAELPARSQGLLQVLLGAPTSETDPGNIPTNSLLEDYRQLLTSELNRAPNGDFENGVASPASWLPPAKGKPGEINAGFSPDARFGKRSLQLTVPNNESANWVGWRSGELAVRPGATYWLGGWLKALGLKGSASIHAHFHNSSGALTKSGAMVRTHPAVGGDSEWQNSTALLKAPPDAASIQIHLTMNTAGTLRHDGLALWEVVDGHVAGVHTVPDPGSKAVFRVWEVNPLVKVFPATPPQAQVRQVSVELAGNEYEPFQLAFRGYPDAPAQAVDISVSVLTNSNGATLPPISIQRVGFVPVDHPSAYYSTDVPDWCRKVPRGAGATDGWAGWWPDPLLPQPSFQLSSDQTQPVWFTVHALKGAPPGEYRGELRIKAAGVEAAAIPLLARVLPFSLPDQTQLRAIFDLRFGPGGPFGSPAKSKAERKNWLRFMADHRLAIDAIQPAPKFAYKDGQVTMDAAEFDEEARYCFDELGMNAAYTPHFFYMFGWAYPPKKFFGLEPFTPAWISAFKQSYRLFSEHVRAKGWHDKFVYYISDEPHFEHDFVVEQMAKLCALIHEVDPAIPIYSSTWRHCRAWDNALDLWGVGQHGSFPVAELERLQKAGKQMWFTCDGQMATDTPLLATERMLPYYCHKYGVRGFEFWGFAWWTYDPWKTGWHQFIRQSNEGQKYYWVRYPNGDGFLAYPGKAAGVEGPVSTIRLEQVREGLEDYEAMMILQRLLQAAKGQDRPTAAGEAALKLARDLVTIPNAGGLRSTEILPDPDQIPKIRHKVNATIAGLGR